MELSSGTWGLGLVQVLELEAGSWSWSRGLEPMAGRCAWSGVCSCSQRLGVGPAVGLVLPPWSGRWFWRRVVCAGPGAEEWSWFLGLGGGPGAGGWSWCPGLGSGPGVAAWSWRRGLGTVPGAVVWVLAPSAWLGSASRWPWARLTVLTMPFLRVPMVLNILHPLVCHRFTVTRDGKSPIVL